MAKVQAAAPAPAVDEAAELRRFLLEAPGTRSGYRSTARVTDRALQERLDALTVDAYGQAVEKLLARAQALRPIPIREQMAQAAKEANGHNAARPAPTKGKETRDDR